MIVSICNCLDILRTPYTIVLVADIACADGGSNKLFELFPEQDR
jgi:hypothetical protein